MQACTTGAVTGSRFVMLRWRWDNAAKKWGFCVCFPRWASAQAKLMASSAFSPWDGTWSVMNSRSNSGRDTTVG